MKTQLRLLLPLLVFAMMANVAIAQVKSDYDKTVDFTKYKTYTFAGWAENSDKILNDLDKKRMLDAFKKELDSRGLTLVDENGDVAITLYIVVEQKTSTTAYTNYNGGMGYGYGRWGWGGGFGSATTTYSEDDYLEGTVVIDFYDSGTKKLVWQGVITKEVTQNPQKREKTIPKSVSKLMYQYPVKATKK
ncbi:MAG: DUF4136 domain-containing protein [Cyclobacteriaceae bacterium]|nr:DUF4136 domain-containing protein [Cyclobacteriaceae bacterium]